MTDGRVVGEKILEYLDQIDKDGGKALKWHLEKIAGNKANFERWVDRCLIEKYRFVVRVTENGKEFYAKTAEGEKVHQLLKSWGPFLPYLLEFGSARLQPWLRPPEDLFR